MLWGMTIMVVGALARLAGDLHVVGDDEQVPGLDVGIVLVTET